MKRAAAILLACVCAATCFPSVKSNCEYNSQCNVGYYCNFEHYSCFECMRCEDLKRAPLPVVASCIKSIAECGVCLPGLVADPSGNLDAPCVPADSLAGPALSYKWVTLAVAAVLFLFLMVGILVYALRKTDTFKMVSFTRASFQSPCARNPDVEPGAPPPPYNEAAAYLPVRPTSPPPDQPAPPQTPAPNEESSRPFLKRLDSRRLRAPQERDSNQEAQVFQNPYYVRAPELPPSYDSTVNGDATSPEHHDEDTMESLWTPADDANNNSTQNNAGLPAAAGASLSALLSEARGTTAVRPPGATAVRPPGATAVRPPDRAVRDDATPSKVVCVRQDSNNNSNGRRGQLEIGEGSASTPAPPPPAPAPAPQLTALSFNITVQQHNDVKLITT